MIIESIKEWTLNYIRYRDTINQTIEKIEPKESIIFVKHTNKIQNYFLLPSLEIPKINKNEETILVTLNTKENIKFLIKNWSKFIEYNTLSIIFLNPKLEVDCKWIVNPYIHDKITEKKVLEKSLMVMLETVPEYS